MMIYYNSKEASRAYVIQTMVAVNFGDQLRAIWALYLCLAIWLTYDRSVQKRPLRLQSVDCSVSSS